MSENKTRPTTNSVTSFLDAVEDESKHMDSYVLLDLMMKITGQPPVMWGQSIVDFSSYHYKYATGREGDMLLSGFHQENKTFRATLCLGLTAIPI